MMKKTSLKAFLLSAFVVPLNCLIDKDFFQSGAIVIGSHTKTNFSLLFIDFSKHLQVERETTIFFATKTALKLQVKQLTGSLLQHLKKYC